MHGIERHLLKAKLGAVLMVICAHAIYFAAKPIDIFPKVLYADNKKLEISCLDIAINISLEHPIGLHGCFKIVLLRYKASVVVLRPMWLF